MISAAAQERLAALLARPALARLLSALDGEGEQARIIGGAVRNTLLGDPVDDIDITTTALPQETMRRGRAAGFKAVPTGLDHGTVTLIDAGEVFEVTTLRRDVESHGRHATVAFGRDFREDALRRDFTINGLGLDRDGVVHDHAGGLADLAARRVRFIGQAGQRIGEDYLRILRFFRFHARYGAGEPDTEGYRACIEGRAGLDRLSRERVRAEMMKLLAAKGAATALRAMAGGGLLMPVLGGCLPRISRFAAVAGAEDAGSVHPAFRLAALAACNREDAVKLRAALKLSNDEFDRIERLAQAQEGIVGLAVLPSVAGLRHLAERTGREAVAGALVLVTAADAGRQGEVQGLIAALGRTPRFLPGGREALVLGLSPGPGVGAALARARRDWIEAGCPEGSEAQAGFLERAIAFARHSGASRSEEPGTQNR